ncbi:MAG: HesA/MoeB/ThiF family protein [Candidatus Njordarchaeia archaeon]
MKGNKNEKMHEVPLMFSRILMAGINPLSLSNKTVTIFGLGGLGVVVAEIMARLGVGKLILVDRDVVSLENLNRLGYDISDLDKPKVEALRKKLEGIKKARDGLKIEIETHYVDIIAWERLGEIIRESDLVFTCLDNLEARLEVNYWVVKYKKPLVDAGTSLNGLKGTIITVIPYQTPCLGCYYDIDTLLESEDEKSAVNCGASLPTTMTIVAAIQADVGLRLLLGKRDEVVPRIFVNLENGVKVTWDVNVKRRRNCRYCGGDENE